MREKGALFMNATIRPFREEDLQTVLDISLRAFTPIHESFERLLGTELFRFIYPELAGVQSAIRAVAVRGQGERTDICGGRR